jgi:hypothetical protein
LEVRNSTPRPLRVTKNLYAALKSLRRLYASLKVKEEGDFAHFWIDAICINQSDNDKRSRQVRMTGEIYAKSESTFIWLGNNTATYLALNMAHELQVHAMRRLGPEADLMNAESDVFQQLARAFHLPNDHSPIEAESLIRALDHLILSNPYFRRIWVLQEAVVGSKKTAVLCANRIFSIMDVYFAYRFREAWREMAGDGGRRAEEALA